MYVSASAYISSSSLAPGCMKITPLVIRNKDRKSTRLNSSHSQISYAVFCLKKKKTAAVLPLHVYTQDSMSPHQVAVGGMSLVAIVLSLEIEFAWRKAPLHYPCVLSGLTLAC